MRWRCGGPGVSSTYTRDAWFCLDRNGVNGWLGVIIAGGQQQHEKESGTQTTRRSAAGTMGWGREESDRDRKEINMGAIDNIVIK